jgi:Recombinase zinc beta ribbon domain
VQLTEIMQAAGLTSRPTAKHPARPLSQTRLYELLSDRYYLGVVSYQGDEYPGRHEPLIDADLFARAQRVLAIHGGGGTRRRKYSHHLKGLLWCGRCGHRLILARAQGNGGSYFYFLRRGRQQHACTLPYLAVDRVSRAVERHYAGIRLSQDFRDRVRAQLDDVLKHELAGLSAVKQRLRERLARLDRQEDQYLELIGDPGWPQAKLKQKLAAIEQSRTEIERQLRDATSSLDTGRRFFLLALDLLGDPQACYRQADDDLKRALTRLLFSKLYVDEDAVTGDQLTDGFRELVLAERPDKPADLGADSPLHDLSPIPGWDGAQVPGPRTWSLTGPGSSNPLWVDEQPVTLLLLDRHGRRLVVNDYRTSAGFRHDPATAAPLMAASDVVVLSNSDVNHDLLAPAGSSGATVVCDVQAITRLDSPDRPFCQAADILFASAERLDQPAETWLAQIMDTFDRCQIAVAGMGERGAARPAGHRGARRAGRTNCQHPWRG